MVKSWTRLFLIFGLFLWFFNFSTSSTFEKSANSANTLVKIISLIFKVSGMYPIYHYFRKGENIWRLFAKTTIIFFTSQLLLLLLLTTFPAQNILNFQTTHTSWFSFWFDFTGIISFSFGTGINPNLIWFCENKNKKICNKN